MGEFYTCRLMIGHRAGRGNVGQAAKLSPTGRMVNLRLRGGRLLLDSRCECWLACVGIFYWGGTDFASRVLPVFLVPGTLARDGQLAQHGDARFDQGVCLALAVICALALTDGM